ncbi:MAG: hypothetical protein A2268_06155 [Candidatus Raymondbacteria bacterium RifOxyA12_full_50_37]|uniref:ThuA-like domain-containing protein n=1 Tax=Candidatus Raymondbacteria bacterium RIFOXYD12_FULL_49_13 TaxID=1817890 RepID=A0A1F7FKM9_UNCRA|nr:MAG: hypothetical protein A2268_06155 [Candidatus Raymondbacteria bacterium RifOxyA12_full_50_37]OGJ94551.1 MAG: hypothetical protein A2248_15085 [Candidatus Raymondbacteria bacterium RIFOXYA2_FULL_49_16]OGJ95880.1 MAG: hypothetical protein A2487_02880 [Candidatus Raymondbacteria bacterium RifOxyC12_full_50_8]OGK01700.1 MAG: hypothetical protein A2350_10815 [Candidatus Raymondbacteria bacterium RifOxyB12_full_50_8]OGK07027.1 MAG: hypothetical protein A2519_13725 [Candidatus Raymondbacteria b
MKHLSVAMLTGEHPYDVPAFTAMLRFRLFNGIDFFIQSLDDFVCDYGRCRTKYDVVIFYNFHKDLAEKHPAWWQGNRKKTLLDLGKTRQGIIVLHHGLCTFPKWPFWSRLIGITDRKNTYTIDQSLSVSVQDRCHPVMRGLSSWTINDDAFILAGKRLRGSKILLTTDHPKSMPALAWTRSFGKARVFCCALGHGAEAYNHPAFQKLLYNALYWTAQ